MYSADMRSRALKLLEENKFKKKKIADILGIDRKTLYQWEKVYKTEGRSAPLTIRTKSADSRRKIKLPEFKAFIDLHNDWTLNRMAKEFYVSKMAVITAIKAIGYTRKKNNIYSKKEKKKIVRHIWKQSKILSKKI